VLALVGRLLAVLPAAPEDAGPSGADAAQGAVVQLAAGSALFMGLVLMNITMVCATTVARPPGPDPATEVIWTSLAGAGCGAGASGGATVATAR